MKKLSANLSQRIHKFGNMNEKSIFRPVCMILSGSAYIVNNQLPKEKQKLCELRNGDIFGESDLIRHAGIDFFGDIVAGPNGLECLVLMAPDQLIHMFERESIRNTFGGRHKLLLTQLERTYSQLAEAPILKY